MGNISMNEPLPLPDGIASRRIEGVNGLSMHVLEAGDPNDPLLLLLHGFPELAFSWRKVMLPLARAGYRVIAPDQRGYGRTTGWEDGFDIDIRPFGILNLVRDTVALLIRLGCSRTAAVVGHDFGAVVAPYCSLIRPDLFPRLATMSAPFGGPPSFADEPPQSDIHQDLLALARPRKHYQWYYSTPRAAADMLGAAQGFKAFMRAYYHVKSADWPGNQPFELTGWTATELEKLPTYYIMDASADMARTVAPYMPDRPATWLTDAELDVYVTEFTRTGLQAPLNWYRCGTCAWQPQELKLFGGLPIRVPTSFISGARDWGVHQRPGTLRAMQVSACADFRRIELIEGAGHWVQQEQPEAVADALLRFLRS
jgi:pimeloyl-ACP methyl ester carboxylesterase